MKAIVYETYGPPTVLALRDVAKPVPKDNEILIRIGASVATPPDCAFRSGVPFVARFFTGLTRPRFKILGGNFAGEVEAVGAAISRFKAGDRVYGASDSDFGTYSEYKCLPEDGAIAVTPVRLGDGEAAGLSEGFLTAMPFLRDHAGLRAGQHILVNGASGSIGTVAVQLAKHLGARVTGVCSTANVALVRSLGADDVIDYTKDDFTACRGAYDVVFDTVGKSSFRLCRDALRATGIYMTTAPSLGILGQMLTTRGRAQRALLATTGLRPVSEKAKDLLLMNGLVEAGVLRAVIDRHYPLERTDDAHAYVETGRKRGSVVIDIGAGRPLLTAPQAASISALSR